MSKPRRVVFYCSGCNQRVTRMVRPPVKRYYLSFCATAGAIIKMRKSRDQSEVLSHTAPVEIW